MYSFEISNLFKELAQPSGLHTGHKMKNDAIIAGLKPAQ